MKKETRKTILQVIVSILTAALTAGLALDAVLHLGRNLVFHYIVW